MPKLDRKKVVYKKWNNLEINTRDDSGCYEDMLDRIYKLMHHTLNTRKRILAFRIDLRATGPEHIIQEHFCSNKILTDFLAKYRKKYLRSGIKKTKKNDSRLFAYFWAREVSTEKKAHYHLLLFVDGSQHRSAYMLQKNIKEEWEKHIISKTNNSLNGLPHFCKDRTQKHQNPTCQYVLYREDGEDEHFKNCFKRASYLVKEKQKRGIYFERNNRFGYSQIPKDFKVDKTMKSYGPQTKKKSFFGSAK